MLAKENFESSKRLVSAKIREEDFFLREQVWESFPWGRRGKEGPHSNSKQK